MLTLVPKIPRSCSRCEWAEMHRWRRVVQRDLRKSAEFARQALATIADDMAFGTPRRRDIIEQFVNPPVLLGPYQ